MFFRKFILAVFIAGTIISDVTAAAGTGFVEEEPEVDITEWFSLPEEERIKDKKDSDGAYLMTVSCTGDFTIGGDNYHHKDLFKSELEKHNGDINFTMTYVRDIFLDDDLTIVNFEGTLTDTKYVPSSKKENDFLFNITPSAVSVLPDNGIEAVSLDNNHVRDHGDEGLEDTKAAFIGAGTIYSTPNEVGVFDYKDGLIQVAMLSFNCIDRYGTGFKKSKFASEYDSEFLNHDTFEEAVCDRIRKVKEKYPLLIVSFHWGIEKKYSPTNNQIRLGRMAVDAGADLVIGHHPHRLQPIECYKGVYICYSLGNFCFAGHNAPSDMTSIIFQARYRVKGSSVSFKDFRVIPIRISSVPKLNNFTPKPIEDGYTRDSVLNNTLKDKANIKNLEYAVTDFPLEWQ